MSEAEGTTGVTWPEPPSHLGLMGGRGNQTCPGHTDGWLPNPQDECHPLCPPPCLSPPPPSPGAGAGARTGLTATWSPRLSGVAASWPKAAPGSTGCSAGWALEKGTKDSLGGSVGRGRCLPPGIRVHLGEARRSPVPSFLTSCSFSSIQIPNAGQVSIPTPASPCQSPAVPHLRHLRDREALWVAGPLGSREASVRF